MMKRILLFVISATLSLGSAMAQEGLYVEDLFEGRVVPQSQMKRSFISGSSLKPYNLDTYKSLTFTVDEATFHSVEILILNDAQGTEDQQLIYDEGHLVYALVCIPPTHSGLNRFLCFQAAKTGRLWDTTVVYLRGVASIGDLDKMFNKKRK